MIKIDLFQSCILFIIKKRNGIPQEILPTVAICGKPFSSINCRFSMLSPYPSRVTLCSIKPTPLRSEEHIREGNSFWVFPMPLSLQTTSKPEQVQKFRSGFLGFYIESWNYPPRRSVKKPHADSLEKFRKSKEIQDPKQSLSSSIEIVAHQQVTRFFVFVYANLQTKVGPGKGTKSRTSPTVLLGQEKTMGNGIKVYA